MEAKKVGKRDARVERKKEARKEGKVGRKKVKTRMSED